MNFTWNYYLVHLGSAAFFIYYYFNQNALIARKTNVVFQLCGLENALILFN